MNFLKRLFGGEQKAGEQGYSDPDGIYFHVQCDRCGSYVRLRVHKTHDVNRTDDGYVWHKTIIDSRCFRPIPTVVHLDRNYQVTRAEIEGGHYVSEAEYRAAVSETTDTDTASE